MIDTNYKYAQWSTNVNVSGMNWQTYHEGKWYNPAEQTYSQAVDELKETIRQKVLSDHPHLIAFDKQEDKPEFNIKSYDKFGYHGAPVKATHVAIPEHVTVEKINKGTIEEQIQACTEIESPNGLLSFEYLAKMNKKVKGVYDKKLKELSHAKESIK